MNSTNQWTTVSGPKRFGNGSSAASSSPSMFSTSAKLSTAAAARDKFGQPKHIALSRIEEENRRMQMDAARKKATAMDFTSHDSYPTLGSNSAVTTSKHTMNFKQVMVDAAIEEAAYKEALEKYQPPPRSKSVARVSFFPTPPTPQNKRLPVDYPSDDESDYESDYE